MLEATVCPAAEFLAWALDRKNFLKFVDRHEIRTDY